MEWKKSISLLIISYVAATFAQGPLDFTTSNNYQIINCNYPQPNSYASKLQSLLPNILFFLRETVLPDARSGNKGSSAFATFFTDNQSRAGVASIFHRIISARKVRSKRSGRLEKPRFGCLKENAESQLEREGYQHVCTGKQGGSMPAIHISDAEDVYLCSPEFFNFPLWPTTADCPTVEGGKLVPNDYRLSKNQMSILIHELAHLHGVNDRSGAAVEQYQVDDCAALRPMAKLKNAQNFALYAAALWANCDLGPNDRTELRRLVSVDDLGGGALTLLNETALAAATAPGAVSGSQDVYPLDAVTLENNAGQTEESEGSEGSEESEEADPP